MISMYRKVLIDDFEFFLSDSERDSCEGEITKDELIVCGVGRTSDLGNRPKF